MPTTVKIAACQVPDIREDVEASLNSMRSFAEAADVHGARLVCFPECFLQGYLCDERARRHAMDLSSAAFKSVLERLNDLTPTLVFGLIESDGGSLFNTAAVVREGQLLGRYRKTHLLSGERIFTAGTEYPVFRADGLTFGINICYDTNFAEAAAALAVRGADLIVCPSNNMMSLSKAMAYKDVHNDVRARRTKETGTWLISSDVTGECDGRLALGPTAVINPDGRVVAQVPLRQTGLVTAEIECYVRERF
jgi:predicted amidohydrolase